MSLDGGVEVYSFSIAIDDMVIAAGSAQQLSEMMGNVYERFAERGFDVNEQTLMER